jgi:hypothetical protein
MDFRYWQDSVHEGNGLLFVLECYGWISIAGPLFIRLRACEYRGIRAGALFRRVMAGSLHR